MADINRRWPWPHNVGILGTYPEEVKALQRAPEKNPDASPLPDLAPSRLLTPNRSSDNIRMGEADVAKLSVIVDGGEASRVTSMIHVVFRRLLLRTRRRGILLFDDAVETGNLDDVATSRRDQMKSMLAREHAMLDLVARYNSLAEALYNRLLSESKG